MNRLTRSNVGRLAQDGSFFWAAGIEDTFITHPWPATGRTLDEYELTLHYDRFREDLELFLEAGVRTVRYGIPWHRVNPAPDQWDWSFADQSLGRLIELRIEPIVDLVHYGLPSWLTDAYLNPDFPKRMAEYSARLADRFKGLIHAYTPLNEPRVTAWYCGKLGWWPPGRRGWRGFLQVMCAVCTGIVETVRTLQQLDPDILPVQVDATDLYETAQPELEEEVFRRQELVFLALDLISGRVNESHTLFPWLLKNGVAPDRLEWFRVNRIDTPLIGINLYPLFSRKILSKSRHGLRTRMPYAGAEIIDRLASLYWDRYKVPLFISETASEGSARRRSSWLNDSVEAVRRVRERQIPLVGYTWWPLFALVTWGYRQGTRPPECYLKQMGLWDLQDVPGRRLERVPTPLVRQYRELALGGIDRAGRSRVAA